MVQQKHVIQRQVFEVTAEDPAQAQWLQTEISRMYQDRIAPLIDMCCTEVSQTGRVDRVDYLDLDIGYIDPQRLEEELVAKLLPALREALSAKILERERETPRGPGPGIASQLELLAYFARYGSLPWWADSTRSGLLAETLQQLVSAAPEYLRALMRELSSDVPSLRRIVRHYGAEALSTLVGLLAPQVASTIPGLPLEIAGLLRDAQQHPDASAGHTQEVVWQSMLIVAGGASSQASTIPRFYQEALIQAAGELGMSYASLVRTLSQSVREISISPSVQLSHLLQTLEASLPGTAAEPPEDARRNMPQDILLDALLDAPPEMGQGGQESTWSELLALVAQLPSPYRQTVAAALSDLEIGRAGTLVSRDTLARIVQTLQPALAEGALLPELTGDLLAALRRMGAAAGLSLEVLTVITAPLHDTLLEPLRETRESEIAADRDASALTSTNIESGSMPQDMMPEALVTEIAVPTSLDISFSDAGRIYVHNAGLVLLWPFIERFFERLGLVGEGQFRNATDMHRGAGLLQYIASGEAPSLEYLLPLNKVLCGMELTEVFDFGPPLTEAEAEECESLLIATIGHASVLRDMSAQSFRSGFLLREGVLSTRDGAWLLQVERNGYDVVIDLFPWSMQWLKLPWMDSPLRVEW